MYDMKPVERIYAAFYREMHLSMLPPRSMILAGLSFLRKKVRYRQCLNFRIVGHGE